MATIACFMLYGAATTNPDRSCCADGSGACSGDIVCGHARRFYRQRQQMGCCQEKVADHRRSHHREWACSSHGCHLYVQLGMMGAIARHCHLYILLAPLRRHCGYCSHLSSAVSIVPDSTAGQVRWVVGSHPLEPLCLQYLHLPA